MSRRGVDMPLECRTLGPEWADALADFFQTLTKAGDEREFHPHPLTANEAARRCHYSGKDLYYVLVAGGNILGYGMLRGWDEGYDVPSLGIALHPAERGKGLGKVFMHFLHAAAKRHGATRIRLKVYPHNDQAVRLYEALGYRFESREAGQLVGFFDL
jgi:ribosomal protein S18 acetylase RimI-like enzyme